MSSSSSLDLKHHDEAQLLLLNSNDFLRDSTVESATGAAASEGMFESVKLKLEAFTHPEEGDSADKRLKWPGKTCPTCLEFSGRSTCVRRSINTFNGGAQDNNTLLCHQGPKKTDKRPLR